jgi:hypothetical protein
MSLYCNVYFYTVQNRARSSQRVHRQTVVPFFSLPLESCEQLDIVNQYLMNCQSLPAAEFIFVKSYT